MNDSLFVALQHLIPHHALSRLVGTIAESEISWVKDPMIRWFSNRYGVNLDEALENDPLKYSSFNNFFTRQLKEGARPVDGSINSITSPADGVVSQFGSINAGSMIQAKGKDFTVKQLLACDAELADKFQNGQFATVYLSPKDYHRVHMPCDATLKHMTFVPGKLFSVNEVTANNVSGLFARNERVVAVFDTPTGMVAMVLVGAMIVASIETVWAGEVAPIRQRIQHYQYEDNKSLQFSKGDEMGRFKLGSTVVMLSENPNWSWESGLEAGSEIQMGEKLASVNV